MSTDTTAELEVSESQRLKENEQIIERGLNTFIEVGNALAEIRDSKLYRAEHSSFEQYCRERWGLSKTHGDRLIGAAKVAEAVTPIGVKPTNEAQARPLTTLETPKEQAEAWEEAVEQSDGQPTAKDVAEVVDRRKQQRSDKSRKTADVKTVRTTEGLRGGDFREVLADLEDDSIKLILTDPPYGKDHLPLWDGLGELAARVLTNDGLLVSYSGQMYLPQAVNALSQHLSWWWCGAVVHEGNGNLTPLGQPVKKVINQWKPILIFSKPGGAYPDTFRDLVPSGGASKDNHNWEQPVAESAWLIEHFTSEGDWVVDPFAGSNTVGMACQELGRRFVGAEIEHG